MAFVPFKRLNKNNKIDFKTQHSEEQLINIINNNDYLYVYGNIKKNFPNEESWHKYKNGWTAICNKQKLTENFMRRFKDHLIWAAVSENQMMSEEFVLEFISDIYLEYLDESIKFSEEFFEKLFALSCKIKHNVDLTRFVYRHCLYLSDEFCERNDDRLKFKIVGSFTGSVFSTKTIWLCEVKKHNPIFHRTLGPAIVYDNGDVEYWYRGIRVNVDSYADFQRAVKLKLFL